MGGSFRYVKPWLLSNYLSFSEYFQPHLAFVITPLHSYLRVIFYVNFQSRDDPITTTQSPRLIHRRLRHMARHLSLAADNPFSTSWTRPN
jgi:hypothetical protein